MGTADINKHEKRKMNYCADLIVKASGESIRGFL